MEDQRKEKFVLRCVYEGHVTPGGSWKELSFDGKGQTGWVWELEEDTTGTSDHLREAGTCVGQETPF